MAVLPKVLGQLAPSAATQTTLYTCTTPALSAVCAGLIVCNRGATDATFRIAIRPAGATLATLHYVYYDVIARANDTSEPLLKGLCLTSTDVVAVYASNANLSFTLTGMENSS